MIQAHVYLCGCFPLLLSLTQVSSRQDIFSQFTVCQINLQVQLQITIIFLDFSIILILYLTTTLPKSLILRISESRILLVFSYLSWYSDLPKVTCY